MLTTAFKWMSGLLFGAFCGVYALVFRRYKLTVEHHQKLTDLFNDPNVRVASGSQSQEIKAAYENS